MTGIELCAIYFLAKDPIPSVLGDLYRAAYHCHDFQPLQKDRATESIERINDYFPAKRPVWPVLTDPLKEGSLSLARLWLAAGVTPGFLLPRSRLDRPVEQAKILSHLRDMGAVPIAAVKDARLETLNAARYYWCMHGACPAGWYLQDGIDESLAYAPEALYVSAGHWKERPTLPIPDRMFGFEGKTVLPWRQIQPVESLADMPGRYRVGAYEFVPDFQMRWSWLGAEFRYEGMQLVTDRWGEFILAFGRWSFRIWDRIRPVAFNLLSIINENLSWIVLMIAGFNILLLVRAVFRRDEGQTA